MDSVQLIYLFLITCCAFLVHSSLKKQKKYKKEGMEVIFLLDYDDRVLRIVCISMSVVLVVISSIGVYNSIFNLKLPAMEIFYLVIWPVMFVILYTPLMHKTKITTLGILRRNNMIRWDSIKVIDYIKLDGRNKQQISITHKTPYKENKIFINFNKDDEQYELFKNTVKEYRNNKKNKKKGNKVEK